MEKQQSIVFFVGAGFSAPFGLPVMGNFIDKARDLYFSDVTKYSELLKTLQSIEKYSKVKNYMNVNLHNIEDLLSISYMELILSKRRSLFKNITEFIKIVISSYTPDDTNNLLPFCALIANTEVKESNEYIMAYDIHGNAFQEFKRVFEKKDKNSSFGVISLNYDRLVETTLSKIAIETGSFYLRKNIENVLEKQFRITKNLSESGIPMAKLHGSIETTIVPPTWNKNINKSIEKDWELAYKLLSDSTHVIFLGYSLPATDNYIKYLLACSLNQNIKLKKVSIITKDSDGNTSKRYSELFSLPIIFHNTNMTNFFEVLTETNGKIDFDYFDEYFAEYCDRRNYPDKEIR